jgi:hypothetical protein
MTDQEKIKLLRNALKNLMQSADSYIEDGAWIEQLTDDIALANAVFKQTKPIKPKKENQ